MLNDPFAAIRENGESILMLSQWWEPCQFIFTDKASYEKRGSFWTRTERKRGAL